MYTRREIKNNLLRNNYLPYTIYSFKILDLYVIIQMKFIQLNIKSSTYVEIEIKTNLPRNKKM